LPLVCGVNLFKRFSTTNSKIFDPKSAKDNPPENCGYALRIFKINLKEETLEIKKEKLKNIDMKINLTDIVKTLVNSQSKKIVNKLRNITFKPNNVANKILNQDYIPFSLIVENNSIDLSAQNYQIYSCFTNAIEEIIKYKKQIKEILKYIENKM